MKEKLHEYALISEVIGGIAIIITLFMLVLETKDNTNAIQAQTYQGLTSELNQVRRDIYSSDLTDIYLKYTESGFNQLSDNEKYKLIQLQEALWGVYESAFYAEERKVLGPDEWLRFENAICRNYKVVYPLWHPEEVGQFLIANTNITSIANNITPKFKDYVESLCK